MTFLGTKNPVSGPRWEVEAPWLSMCGPWLLLDRVGLRAKFTHTIFTQNILRFNAQSLGHGTIEVCFAQCTGLPLVASSFKHKRPFGKRECHRFFLEVVHEHDIEKSGSKETDGLGLSLK